MATYYSDLWRLGRSAIESGAEVIAATFHIPDGTAVATSDVFKICELPAGTLVTSVLREIPVDLADTIASTTLNLGSTAVTGDLTLGTDSCAAVALATTNAFSSSEEELKFTLGSVTTGATTANRKIHLVIGVARFKNRDITYDWNGEASERIDYARDAD